MERVADGGAADWVEVADVVQAKDQAKSGGERRDQDEGCVEKSFCSDVSAGSILGNPLAMAIKA